MAFAESLAFGALMTKFSPDLFTADSSTSNSTSGSTSGSDKADGTSSYRSVSNSGKSSYRSVSNSDGSSSSSSSGSSSVSTNKNTASAPSSVLVYNNKSLAQTQTTVEHGRAHPSVCTASGQASDSDPVARKTAAMQESMAVLDTFDNAAATVTGSGGSGPTAHVDLNKLTVQMQEHPMVYVRLSGQDLSTSPVLNSVLDQY